MTHRSGPIDSWESMTPHAPRRLSAPPRQFVATENSSAVVVDHQQTGQVCRPTDPAGSATAPRRSSRPQLTGGDVVRPFAHTGPARRMKSYAVEHIRSLGGSSHAGLQAGLTIGSDSRGDQQEISTRV